MFNSYICMFTRGEGVNHYFKNEENRGKPYHPRDMRFQVRSIWENYSKCLTKTSGKKTSYWSNPLVQQKASSSGIHEPYMATSSRIFLFKRHGFRFCPRNQSVEKALVGKWSARKKNMSWYELLCLCLYLNLTYLPIYLYIYTYI